MNQICNYWEDTRKHFLWQSVVGNYKAV